MAKGVSVGVEITGSAKGFKAAAEDAAKSTAALNREARAKAREIEQSFKQVTIAMAKIGGAVIAAKQAFTLYSAVMKTTGEGADKLEKQLLTVESAMTAIKETAKNFDWNNLARNIGNAMDAASNRADSEDINDTRALDLQLRKSDLQARIAELRVLKQEGTIKREDAEELKKINEELFQTEQDILKHRIDTKIKFAAEMKGIDAKIFGDLKEGILNRSKLNDSEYRDLQEITTQTKKKIEELKKANTKKYQGETAMGGVVYRLDPISYAKDLQAYLSSLSSMGRVQVFEDLFSNEKDWQSIIGYFSTLNDLMMQFNQAESKINKSTTGLSKGPIGDKLALLQGKGFNGSLGSIPSPRLAIPKQFERDMKALAEKNAIDEMNKSLERQDFIIGSLSRGFDELFSGGKDGFKNMIDSMITDFRRLVTEILIKKAVMAIFNVVSSGAAGAASASAGASSGLSSTGGVIMSNQPVQFEAKVDNKYIYLSGKYYANKLGNTT